MGQLSYNRDHLIQSLCSSRITSLQRSYGLVRPSASHRYSHPRGFGHLDFSLVIEATGSRSSLRKPMTDSCHLYAEHRPPSNQTTGGLILGCPNAPSFDAVVRVTTRHQWFTYVHLSAKHLPGFVPTFPTTLTTTALNRSSSGWFEPWLWSPSPKDLPSSLAKLTHQVSKISFLPP